MATSTLLRVKLQLTFNRYRRLGWKKAIGYLALGWFSLLLGINIYHGLVLAMGILGPEAAQNLLVTTLSGVMTFVVFWGMGTILSQFYLTSDLELLLTLPIRRRAIFAVKVLEALQGMLFPGVLALATLWSYGAANAASWPYYVVSALVLLLSLGFALLLSVLLIILIMRYVPVRRAQELWTVMWTLTFAVVWAAWMLFSGGPNAGGQAALEVAASTHRVGTILRWAPAGWAAGLAAAWVDGNWLAVLLNGLALAGLVTGLYLVGQWTFEKVFYEGWSRLQSKPTRRRHTTPVAAGTGSWLALLPGSVRALVRKDWLTLLRDPSRLSRLVFPVLMGVVYTYLLARDASGGAAAYWLAAGLAPAVGFFFGMYVALPAIASEGPSIALMRSVPLTGGEFLAGKLAFCWPPMLLLSEVGAAVTFALIGRTAAGAVGAALLVLWVTLGLAAGGVALGALAPQYLSLTSRRQVGIGASYGYMAFGALFWGASLAAYAVLALAIAPASRPAQDLVALLPWVSSLPGIGWVSLLVLAANLAAWAVLFALWKLASRHMEAFQITDL